MHLRNYIKLLFVLMLTVSVGLFMFSAYALIAGRAMEKEYANLGKEFNNQANTSRTALMNVYISDYELKFLTGKYTSGLSIAKLCYSSEDPKKTEEQNIAIKAYNEECKAKSIPESTVRPEVDDLYKRWIDTRTPIDEKQKAINSRIYADDSGKGKLDRTILDTFTKMAGIGTAISVLVLILLYRIPETVSERKDEHPKQK